MNKKGIFLMVMSILLLIFALPSALWTFTLARDFSYPPSAPGDAYVPVQASHTLGGLVGTLASVFALVPGILGLVYRQTSRRLACGITGGLLTAAGIAGMILLQDLWILLLPLTLLAVLYFIACFAGKPEETGSSPA